MENKGFKAKVKVGAQKLKQYWHEPMQGRYLSFKEVGSFGLYALGNSFITTAIVYVVTITEVPLLYKIDAIHGYIIMLLGTALNMMLQPLMGLLMERSKHKLGKYRPFIIFALPLVALFGILATFLPQLNDQSRIIYAYCTCVPVLALSTYTNNMHQTMHNVITPNSQERADIMTPIGLLVGLAPSILQIIAGPIRAAFLKQGKEYMGLRIIGLISIVVGFLCCLFILKVKERVYDLEGETKEKLGFTKSLKMLGKNKPLMIVFIALVLGSLRGFWRIFMLLMIRFRFAPTVDLALNVSGVPLTFIGFASTVAMVLLPILTRKLDKKLIIIIFTGLNILSLTIMASIGIQNIPIGTKSAISLTIFMFLASLDPTYLIIPLLLGDIADYQQQKTGKRFEGNIQNFIFTIPLLLSQFFMLGASFWQKSIGFEQKDYANLDVIPEALQKVGTSWFNAATIISIVSGLLLILVISFYPLSKKRHNEILEDLKLHSASCEWMEEANKIDLDINELDAAKYQIEDQSEVQSDGKSEDQSDNQSQN